jgi:hypothetical protein
MSPCAPWHRARHPPGKGSGIATCPEAPCTPLARKGLWCCHVPRGIETVTRQERALESPCASWLQARPLCRMALASHVTEALGPPPGRAPISPHVLWLQTHPLVREGSRAATCLVVVGPQACPCVPKMLDIRLIMASPSTRCRQRIKCVCDRPYAAYDRH